ncbi:hypothetical protein ACFVSN_05845 [Kitasatospora sp. NPDC057904]|uniref:hypothetical protein n=1 Tax=unclassified Kitasatospora TaxID=2633591 RepID=UPI0036D920FC
MRIRPRTPAGRLLGLGTATMALAAGTMMTTAGTAGASPGDNVCRSTPVYVGAGFTLLPCVYQDSSSYMHGKAIATGGPTDVYLHVQLGYRCDTSGPVNWVPGTDTATYIPKGGGGATLYTVPSDGIGAFPGCQYFSKTWIVDNDQQIGDVEAGPVIG